MNTYISVGVKNNYLEINVQKLLFCTKAFSTYFWQKFSKRKESREMDLGIERAVQLAKWTSWTDHTIQLVKWVSWTDHTVQLAHLTSWTKSCCRGLDLMPFTEPWQINPSFRIDRNYHWSFTIRTVRTCFPA